MLVVVPAACGVVGLVAHPHLLMPHRLDIGHLSFYCDEAITGELEDEANCVFKQLAGLELFDETHATEIYLCQKPSLYKLFARMCLIPSRVPGFNVSLLNVSFVSLQRIQQIRENGNGFPRYSVFEGDLCHGITHELIHDYMVEKIGYLNNRRLPPWKREGYAEYHASLNRMKADTHESLADRIRIIVEMRNLPEHLLEYYSWRTVTEYLFEVEDCTLDAFLEETVSYDQSFRDMVSWYSSTVSKSFTVTG